MRLWNIYNMRESKRREGETGGGEGGEADRLRRNLKESAKIPSLFAARLGVRLSLCRRKSGAWMYDSQHTKHATQSTLNFEGKGKCRNSLVQSRSNRWYFIAAESPRCRHTNPHAMLADSRAAHLTKFVRSIGSPSLQKTYERARQEQGQNDLHWGNVIVVINQ